MATKSKKVVKKTAKKISKNGSFRLTYATMFSPPEEMHTKYDKALVEVKATLGRDYGMIINNQDRFSAETFEDRSPINTDWVLAKFQKGSAQDVKDAVAAAEAASPKWAGMKWQERVKLMRKVAAQIEKRVYEISAAVSLEIGKNRLEALGDVQEKDEMIWYACE